MSPRSRSVADQDILDAAARVVSLLGPARLTLADVAVEAGLAPATILQRFGSKRGLLLALAAAAVPAVHEDFGAARIRAASPLVALVAALTSMANHARTPEELSNHLAFLQIDLTDPEFHRFALEHARAVLGELQSLVRAAVDANQLVACDTAGLARTLQIAYNGALVSWAIYREGTASDWVRHEIDTVLGPYLTDRGTASESGARG